MAAAGPAKRLASSAGRSTRTVRIAAGDDDWAMLLGPVLEVTRAGPARRVGLLRVEGHVRGQFAVSVNLGEEQLGLLLGAGDDV